MNIEKIEKILLDLNIGRISVKVAKSRILKLFTPIKLPSDDDIAIMSDKEIQKQLIIEIMNEDSKNGLYEPQPTWDDVIKAIDLARKQYLVYTGGDYEFEYSLEEIINQLKKEKQ